MKKAVSGLMLVLLFVGALPFVFDIQPVEAEPGTIYIKADGSIDPPTANITSVDNVTYTLTSNISVIDDHGIVVERDNIVIDGNGHWLQGTGIWYGIYLFGRRNVTIKNAQIKSFDTGIQLSGSLGNTVIGNNLTANLLHSIRLSSSSNSTITGNNVTANYYYGIWLFSSSNNIISANDLTNNGVSIYLYSSSNNTVSGNKIAANDWDGIPY